MLSPTILVTPHSPQNCGVYQFLLFQFLGENICAFIKLNDSDEITEKEIKKFCRDKIADFKQPKKIIIINELNSLNEIPKGPTKKVLYRKLKEYYKKFF